MLTLQMVKCTCQNESVKLQGIAHCPSLFLKHLFFYT